MATPSRGRTHVACSASLLLQWTALGSGPAVTFVTDRGSPTPLLFPGPPRPTQGRRPIDASVLPGNEGCGYCGWGGAGGAAGPRTSSRLAGPVCRPQGSHPATTPSGVSTGLSLAGRKIAFPASQLGLPRARAALELKAKQLSSVRPKLAGACPWEAAGPRGREARGVSRRLPTLPR